MSASKSVFTSPKQFDEFTYKLSQSMKSMKVSTLRESIAKSEGYSHVDAFRKSLAAQEQRPIIRKVIADPKIHRLPDIWVEDKKIFLEGIPVTDAMEESLISEALTGDSTLLRPAKGNYSLDAKIDEMFSGSFFTVVGYVKLRKGSQKNEINILKSIRNFYLGQGPDWRGRDIATTVFYWIYSDAWMTEDKVLQILIDYLSEDLGMGELQEKLRKYAEEYFEYYGSDKPVLGLSFDEMTSFGHKKDLSTADVIEKFSAILTTVFDYLKYVGLKGSEVTRKNIKEKLDDYWFRKVPYLVLPSVFIGMPIQSTDEAIQVGGEQVENISRRLLEEITKHPEIWTMGSYPIEKALDKYYLVEIDSKGLIDAIRKSTAVEFIAGIVFNEKSKDPKSLRITESYIGTALSLIEHLQTSNLSRHSFKKYPFVIYGGDERNREKEISPIIAIYSKEMKGALDLSVANRKPLMEYRI